MLDEIEQKTMHKYKEADQQRKKKQGTEWSKASARVCHAEAVGGIFFDFVGIFDKMFW